MIKKSLYYYNNVYKLKNKLINNCIQDNNPDISINDWMNDYNPDIKQVKVLYVWGQDEISKINRIKKFINKNSDKYGTIINNIYYDGLNWYGIGTAQIAIYNHFRSKQLNYYEMLEFIDYHIHDLKTKNGYVKNNYKLIIFNSIEKPLYIYDNISLEKRFELLGKFKIIEYN